MIDSSAVSLASCRPSPSMAMFSASSFMPVLSVGGCVRTSTVSRNRTGALVSSSTDHGCESPAVVRPPAFGLAGFFLRVAA